MENLVEFVFEGNDSEFIFFFNQLSNLLPDVPIIIQARRPNEKYGYEFHLCVRCTSSIAFQIGMIHASSYAHFGHLKNTVFEPIP